MKIAFKRSLLAAQRLDPGGLFLNGLKLFLQGIVETILARRIAPRGSRNHQNHGCRKERGDAAVMVKMDRRQLGTEDRHLDIAAIGRQRRQFGDPKTSILGGLCRPVYGAQLGDIKIDTHPPRHPIATEHAIAEAGIRQSQRRLSLDLELQQIGPHARGDGRQFELRVQKHRRRESQRHRSCQRLTPHQRGHAGNAGEEFRNLAARHHRRFLEHIVSRQGEDRMLRLFSKITQPGAVPDATQFLDPPTPCAFAESGDVELHEIGADHGHANVHCKS